MREIKFRAWDDGKMVYEKDIQYLMKEDGIKRLFIFFRAIGNDSILMQYTGLKDKNGKEIFEGDLILFQKFANWDDNNEKLKRCLGKVKFLEGCFMWELIRTSNFNKFFPIHRYEPLNHTCDIWGLEVIGNIYENPELLIKKSE